VSGIIYSHGCSVNGVMGIAAYSSDYDIKAARLSGRGNAMVAQCLALLMAVEEARGRDAEYRVDCQSLDSWMNHGRDQESAICSEHVPKIKLLLKGTVEWVPQVDNPVAEMSLRLFDEVGRCHESSYGGGRLTVYDWLAEHMVARQVRAKGPIPQRLWDDRRWQSELSTQAMLASRLLERFRLQAIIQALNTPNGKKVWSFGAPWLVEMVRKEGLYLEFMSKRAKAA
jgi:hypothetical protein